MRYRSTLRPPPRRRSPGQLWSALAAFLCVIVLTLVVARSADAYPCSNPPAERTLMSTAESDCRKPGTSVPKREQADFVSLAFFVAGLVFVLLIPLRYSARGE
ncbi:MAG TPA: hypothetical protein VFL41_11400 [Gaiellaceae bacterium]|nr:hypothetical protein [Gaiellaceae bacterium]